MADRRQRRVRRLAHRLMHCSLRDALAIGLPSMSLLALVSWAALQFVWSAPPGELTILADAPVRYLEDA